jgi:hypothetical protein
LRGRALRRGGSRWRAALQLLLQTLHLLGELLIAVLELLDLTREVAEHTLETIEPGYQIGSILRANRVRQECAHERDHQKPTGTDHSLRHFR